MGKYVAVFVSDKDFNPRVSQINTSQRLCPLDKALSTFVSFGQGTLYICLSPPRSINLVENQCSIILNVLAKNITQERAHRTISEIFENNYGNGMASARCNLERPKTFHYCSSRSERTRNNEQYIRTYA